MVVHWLLFLPLNKMNYSPIPCKPKCLATLKSPEMKFGTYYMSLVRFSVFLNLSLDVFHHQEKDLVILMQGD